MTMKKVSNLRYAKIRKMDVTNGEGIAVSLFTQGCPHHCKGCWNESTWNFNGGKEWTQELEDKIINELCAADYVDCLSILGGEPLCNDTLNDILRICKRFKEKYPNKKLFLWTGYTLEEVKSDNKIRILSYVDVLIEGRYVESKRDLRLYLRGSSNQRIFRKNERGEFYECED